MTAVTKRTTAMLTFVTMSLALTVALITALSCFCGEDE